jgi:uncharacterized surface protein with fasciclin (FAS1) repeats
MKRYTILMVLVIFTLILAACAPANEGEIPPTGNTPAPAATQEVMPTMAPSATMMPTEAAAQAPAEEMPAEVSEQTIVDIAAADGRFTTLVAAVQAAGLVETLQSEGPFTVFAPTDDAFAALPEGTVESLLLPENREQLVTILTYHVLAGKVMAADVVALEEAETVQGQNVRILVEDGNVFINDAQVIITDIEASNGVIHVIDQVILPE